MSIALVSKQPGIATDVADYLVRQNIEGLSTLGARDILGGNHVLEGAKLTIILSPSQHVGEEAELADRIRQKIGPGRQIMACGLRPSERSAQTLYNVGVDEIIVSAGSDTIALAERIQADLIIKGLVKDCGCHDLRGGTKVMQSVFRQIRDIAHLNEAVLIRGETGTGKGLAANALHELGNRAGSFKKIECVAINSNLIESELFGYVKGAFSDAKTDKTGLIESANDGTAFLDEIGDLELSLQKKLLGVVEDKVIRRVGETAERKITSRFVFATHRDLEDGMRERSFREDLYARINRLVVELPPLREHRADIPLLVTHLLEGFNCRNKTKIQLASGAVDELFYYDWPFNVRELDDVVCRAAVRANLSLQITDVMLKESIHDPRELRFGQSSKYSNAFIINPLHESWPRMSERAKHEYFKALARTARDVEHAIELSGLQRAQVFKLLSLYNLKIKS